MIRILLLKEMAGLIGRLKAQFVELDWLEGEIKINLAGLGYDV